MALQRSISLTIDLPSGKTETKEFTSDEPIMIGSGGSAHLKIEDEDVSSLHCMIKPTDEGLVVLDLGSDEGTEVNGKEITGETPLADGDTVTIGSTKMAVHFGGDMLAPTVPIRSMAELEKDLEEPEVGETTLRQESPPDVTAPDGGPAEESEGPELSPDGQTVKKAAPTAPDKTQKMEQAVEVSDEEDEGDIVDQAAAEREKKAAEEAAAKAKKDEAKKSKSAKKDQKKDEKAEKKDAKKAKKAKAASVDDLPERPRKKSTETELVPRKKTTKSGTALATTHGHKKAPKLQPGELDSTVPKEQEATHKDNVDVTMVWGGSVLGVVRLSQSGAVSIGHSPAASFQVSHTSIPAPVYPLVELSTSGAKVNVANGMEATVEGEKKSGAFNLELGQKAVVQVGAIEFVIQYSRKFTPIAVGFFETLDYLATKIFALALLLQIALVAAFLITPNLDDDEDDDLLANLNEWQALILTPPEKKKEKKDLSGKKGAKAKKEEGLFGKKDKPKEDKAASKKGAPTIDKDKREEDRKIAMDALAALGLQWPKGAVSNVLGPGGLGTGINNALGGLKGSSMGDAGGAGGLGSRGTGAGGGGNGLGIGGLGSGTGRGSGGRGGIDLGGRGKGMTRIRPGKVTYKGSLSREEIERVLRRVKNQIRFCYERELNKDPNLQGKIVVGFVIAGTGSVATAKAAQNTMGSKTVASCVLRIIKRLRFPKPKGGGQVIVNYPYLFNPG